MGIGDANTLTDLHERAVAQFSERKFLGSRVGGQYNWLSYRSFGEQVALLRAALASCGVGRGDRVACISDNRTAWVVAAYATYSRGACFVPMHE